LSKAQSNLSKEIYVKKVIKAARIQKAKDGTQEWSERTVNVVKGCQHDSKYCYAKAGNAGRFGEKFGLDPKTWATDVREDATMIKRAMSQCKTPLKIMYPSTHDIHPDNLDLHLQVIESLLQHCKRLMIVSKPHRECIKAICRAFPKYRKKILFRFSIGSANNEVLKFWEPSAPDFQERLACLKYAFLNGYQTSVSCEPMLDAHIEAVVRACRPFVTDAIWLGKISRLKSCLSLNKLKTPEIMAAADELIASQNDERITELYETFRHDRKIRYKKSIKKVVGIPLLTVSGLDR
jgi:DNA repair photolyase